MDGSQIMKLLGSDPIIASKFKGVYSIDQVRYVDYTNQLIVVNLDPWYKPGSHWVVLYNSDQDIVEFFDSRGKKPNVTVQQSLLLRNNTCKYTTMRTQNYGSMTCGLFCFYYSYYACRGCRLGEIISVFSSNLTRNEEIVLRFTQNYVKSFDIDVSLNHMS